MSLSQFICYFTESTKPTRVPYDQWTCDEVTSWLKDDLALVQYTQVFADNAIDGAELASLTSEILQKDLGIGCFLLSIVRYSVYAFE